MGLTGAETDLLAASPPVLSPEAIAGLLRSEWGLEPGRLRPLASERDLNVMVDDSWVLKVSNPAESAEVVAMEVAAMAHAAASGVGLEVPRTLDSGRGPVVAVEDALGRPCLARAISVLPGSPLEGRTITPGLAWETGRVCGLAQSALSGFAQAAALRRLDWDPREVERVWGAAGRPERWAGLVARLEPLAGLVAHLPGGVLHADVTLTNVLAGDGADGAVTGLIDFGDMHHTAFAADLAITLASVVRNTAAEQVAGTWALTRAVIEGYQRQRPLEPAEVDALGELIIARLVLTLLISERRAGLDGGDRAYITQYDDSTRRVLDELAALPPRELAERLHRITGTGRPAPGPSDALRERRASVMGGAVSPLFYRDPLEIVRGEGPWLFGADGSRFLDAYNNVAVVGHAHPAVTGAVARQLREVNTHSRYLHPGAVELAERLVATLPEELDTCLFTTSGTEANELAWRLAVEHTGGNAAIIVRHAYHGSSRWMADLSSNEWPAGHVPPAVGVFDAPRGDVAALTEEVAAARVEAAAAQLRGRGLRPALVLVDPGFTSEGILDAPPAFLRGLVVGAHRVGALFLADEVQSGYGRPGSGFWRHSAAGVVPDIVTMGKPMGSGYPMGGTISRREIVDRLGARYEYFSTFAATPVAAAAGNAVLDVILDSGLIPAAAATGEALRAGLRRLAECHDEVGEVRGTGLIAGVDLYPGRPDARARSRELLEGLTRAGVLAGLTGPDGTVLKVRPPLVWTEDHARLFVGRLAGVLSRRG